VPETPVNTGETILMVAKRKKRLCLDGVSKPQKMARELAQEMGKVWPTNHSYVFFIGILLGSFDCVFALGLRRSSVESPLILATPYPVSGVLRGQICCCGTSHKAIGGSRCPRMGLLHGLA